MASVLNLVSEISHSLHLSTPSQQTNSTGTQFSSRLWVLNYLHSVVLLLLEAWQTLEGINIPGISLGWSL